MAGGDHESRADSGVAFSIDHGRKPALPEPRVNNNTKPKPKLHHNAGPMPKEDPASSVLHVDHHRNPPRTDASARPIVVRVITSPNEEPTEPASFDATRPHSPAEESADSLSIRSSCASDDKILPRSHENEGSLSAAAVAVQPVLRITSGATEPVEAMRVRQEATIRETDSPIKRNNHLTQSFVMTSNVLTEAWSDLRHLEIGIQALGHDEDKNSDESRIGLETSASEGFSGSSTGEDCSSEAYDQDEALESVEAQEGSHLVGSQGDGAESPQTNSARQPHKK
jgi:hypothetical protein